MTSSVGLTEQLNDELLSHLLAHVRRGRSQEDLCFALWRPSNGKNRRSAVLEHVLLPRDGDRYLHGNVSFTGEYVERVLTVARQEGAGLAFLHSHPFDGWQGMSGPDVAAEENLAPRVWGTTGLPLLGMTVGTDGAWSARFWDRVAPRKYKRRWCDRVRVVGQRLAVTFNDQLVPPPRTSDELVRTVSAWGEAAHADLARLHIGIVGVGSVGALVAEALARQGIQNITLIDDDIIKSKNLDRLLYATRNELGHSKVDACAERLKLCATATSFDVRPIRAKLTDQSAYEAALDCDVLFSCVDRPWPRQLANYAAYTHLIPVVDAGIRVSKTSKDTLRSADWRAHIAGPEHICLECLGQYDTSDVMIEREGLLESDEYIQALPMDHFIHNNQNVFGFATGAASLQIMQFIALCAYPMGLKLIGSQMYHFTTGSIEQDDPVICKESCPYPSLLAKGDHADISPVLNSGS